MLLWRVEVRSHLTAVSIDDILKAAFLLTANKSCATGRMLSFQLIIAIYANYMSSPISAVTVEDRLHSNAQIQSRFDRCAVICLPAGGINDTFALTTFFFWPLFLSFPLSKIVLNHPDSEKFLTLTFWGEGTYGFTKYLLVQYWPSYKECRLVVLLSSVCNVVLREKKWCGNTVRNQLRSLLTAI